MLEVEYHHLSTSDASDKMNFWNNLVDIYDKLSLVAQDILAAPASQAYVERGFSVCGSASEMTYIVSSGALNSTHSLLCAACLLQMRACLKLNKKYWRTQASMPLCELWNFNFNGNGL